MTGPFEYHRLTERSSVWRWLLSTVLAAGICFMLTALVAQPGQMIPDCGSDARVVSMPEAKYPSLYASSGDREVVLRFLLSTNGRVGHVQQVGRPSFLGLRAGEFLHELEFENTGPECIGQISVYLENLQLDDVRVVD